MTGSCCKLHDQLTHNMLDAYPRRVAELQESSPRWQQMCNLRERAENLLEGWRNYLGIINYRLPKMCAANPDGLIEMQNRFVREHVDVLTNALFDLKAKQLALRENRDLVVDALVSEQLLKDIADLCDQHVQCLGHSHIWWKLNFTLTKKH